MKNTIKRALLLIPVISVLLVALAVPVFADYSPETGWDAPVGTIEPVDYIRYVYWDSSASAQYVDGSFGLPFDLMGETVTFRYKVVFNIDSTVDYGSGTIFSGGVFAYDNRLGIELEGFGVGTLRARSYSRGTWVKFDSNDTLTCYFEDYPFFDDLSTSGQQTLSLLDFEVYEVSSAPTAEPVTSVFTDIMTWITSALTSVMGAFYVDGSLTLLGTLSVIGVSVGIGFLLIAMIQRFLHLRG